MGRALDTSRCRDCGAPVVFVVVLVDEPKAGGANKLPLEPSYDPDCGIAPSHAANLSRPPTRCRPLRRGEQPLPDERPALTHFATCPARATKDRL